jgi:pimeloyl-ACP methyl ester carboxylesterase
VVGAYAAAHPEWVAGLLLVDPAGDVTQAPANALDRYLARLKSADYARVSRAALQASLSGAKPETSERVLAALAVASPEAFVGCFEGLRRYDPVAALRSYPGDAFAVLQAQRENEATSVHRLLPALRYSILTDVSHFLMLDDPQAFARLLDEFLKQVERRR